MKIMLLSVLALFFRLFGDGDGLTISDKEVVCVISRNTTSEQLEQYRNELWEKKQIRFNILQMEVNKHRIITHLKISVDCNDGFKGGAQMDFKTKKSKMGFSRTYSKGADTAFSIGAIPEKK